MGRLKESTIFCAYSMHYSSTGLTSIPSYNFGKELEGEDRWGYSGKWNLKYVKYVLVLSCH